MMSKFIQRLMRKTLDERFAGTWSTVDLQDLEKFSELLRDSGALKGDLGNRLSKSFVTLSEIKKLIPEGATADSDYILNFINLYEGKTKKAYDNKLPDNQFKISGTKQLDHKLQGQEL